MASPYQVNPLLAHIHRQVDTLPTQNSIPIEDYQHIIRELYALRLRFHSTHQGPFDDALQPLLKKILDLQANLKLAEQQRDEFSHNEKHLTDELEQTRIKNEGLLNDFGYILELYEKSLEENVAVKEELLKVQTERDRAEAQLIQKNSEVRETLERCAQELETFKAERRRLDQEKMEFSKLKRFDKNEGRLTAFVKQPPNIAQSPINEVQASAKDSFDLVGRARHQSCIIPTGDSSVPLKRSETLGTSHPDSRASESDTFDFGPRERFQSLELFESDFRSVHHSFGKTSVALHRSKDKHKNYNVLSLSTNIQQSLLATSGTDHRLIISDLTRELKEVCHFQLKDEMILCSAFTDRNDLLITGAQNNAVGLYSIKGHGKVATLLSHSGPVRCVSTFGFSRAVSGSEDRTLKLWDLKKACFERSVLFYSAVLCLSTSENNIATGHYDGKLRVSSTLSRQLLVDESLFLDDPIDYISVCDSRNSCLAISRSRIAKIFDFRTMKVSKTIVLDALGIFRGSRVSFGVSEDLKELYAGSNSGEIKVCDISGLLPQLKATFKASLNNADVPFVINNDIMNRVICADFEGFVHIIDLNAQQF